MTKEQFNAKMEYLFNEYEAKLFENYDTSALLLNSLDIAKRYYQERESDFRLLTTEKLFPIYKHEIADIAPISYVREELLNIYGERLIIDVTNCYLINTVSTLDLLIENLCKSYFTNVENNNMGVRWRYSINCLDPLNLLKPNGYKSTLSDAFSAYGVFRTLRHALVHNDGELLADKIKSIQKLESGTLSKGSFLDTYFIKGSKIVLTPKFMYILRHWTYNFFYYLWDSFRLTFSTL